MIFCFCGVTKSRREQFARHLQGRGTGRSSQHSGPAAKRAPIEFFRRCRAIPRRETAQVEARFRAPKRGRNAGRRPGNWLVSSGGETLRELAPPLRRGSRNAALPIRGRLRERSAGRARPLQRDRGSLRRHRRSDAPRHRSVVRGESAGDGGRARSAGRAGRRRISRKQSPRGRCQGPRIPGQGERRRPRHDVRDLDANAAVQPRLQLLLPEGAPVVHQDVGADRGCNAGVAPAPGRRARTAHAAGPLLRRRAHHAQGLLPAHRAGAVRFDEGPRRHVPLGHDHERHPARRGVRPEDAFLRPRRLQGHSRRRQGNARPDARLSRRPRHLRRDLRQRRCARPGRVQGVRRGALLPRPGGLVRSDARSVREERRRAAPCRSDVPADGRHAATQ